jgi:hypothetical protein
MIKGNPVNCGFINRSQETKNVSKSMCTIARPAPTLPEGEGVEAVKVVFIYFRFQFPFWGLVGFFFTKLFHFVSKHITFVDINYINVNIFRKHKTTKESTGRFTTKVGR